MQIGMTPGAAETVVRWIDEDGTSVARTLLDAARQDDDSSLRLHQIGGTPRSFAACREHSLLSVIAAAEYLTLDVAQDFSRRLSRIDWRVQMVRIEIGNVEVEEFIEILKTIRDAYGIDAREPNVRGLSVAVSSSSFIPATRPRPDLVKELSDRASSWQTAAARHKFKDFLDSAGRGPQLVDRSGGDRVLAVGERWLKAFSEPIPTTELVHSFAAPERDMRLASIAPRPGPRRPVRLSASPSLD